MDVNLKPELRQFVAEKVNSGEFSSESEVVEESLRRMKERESDIEWVKAQVAAGIADLENGRIFEYESAEEFERDIMKQALARLQRA